MAYLTEAYASNKPYLFTSPRTFFRISSLCSSSLGLASGFQQIPAHLGGSTAGQLGELDSRSLPQVSGFLSISLLVFTSRRTSRQDYKEAARIRDSLKSFEEEEPVLRLQGLLKRAILEERFEDAARYQSELNILAPHTLLKCSSDATTVGIRVQVRSVYIQSRSQPSKEQYFFAYRIRITNNSERPVQLLRRHWIITDGNEKIENIWGIGVIGEQPVILPNTGFEYSSACPLCTPNGRMEGDFEMKHIDMIGSSTFNVAIAPFSLSIMGDETGGIL